MTESTQVVITSPTVENNQALGSRIEETVQMSTYQIKKGLETKRAEAMALYNSLTATERKLGYITQRLSDRLIDKMQDYLEGEALVILNALHNYIQIGEEDTYFSSNRTQEVPFEEIAKAIVEVDKDIHYYGFDKDAHEIYVHGGINIYGSTQDSANYFSEGECVFAPEKICQSFRIEDDERQHLQTVAEVKEKQELANKEVNDIDLKLKDMTRLTEDIRYAMLAEKNKANGDTAVIDIATQISEAYINGTDPSIALLERAS